VIEHYKYASWALHDISRLADGNSCFSWASRVCFVRTNDVNKLIFTHDKGRDKGFGGYLVGLTGVRVVPQVRRRLQITGKFVIQAQLFLMARKVYFCLAVTTFYCRLKRRIFFFFHVGFSPQAVCKICSLTERNNTQAPGQL
jgi:hypothetical protein